MKNGEQMYERFPPPHASTIHVSIVRPRMFSASNRSPNPHNASPSASLRRSNAVPVPTSIKYPAGTFVVDAGAACSGYGCDGRPTRILVVVGTAVTAVRSAGGALGERALPHAEAKSSPARTSAFLISP